ncbi:MAG: hypothetical protein NVS4B3_00890 [Gemmatimonadaceae bacterium]
MGRNSILDEALTPIGTLAKPFQIGRKCGFYWADCREPIPEIPPPNRTEKCDKPDGGCDCTKNGVPSR